MTTLPALSAKLDHQAGRLDSWVAGRQFVYKPANTDRFVNTQSDDPDLTVQLEAHAVYKVTSFWVYLCAVNAVDVNIGFDAPSGTDGRWGGPYNLNTDSIAHFDAKTWTQSVHIHAGAGNEGCAIVTGTIWTTTTAGTLAVYWAQLNASGTALSLKLGSYLEVVRVADN